MFFFFLIWTVLLLCQILKQTTVTHGKKSLSFVLRQKGSFVFPSWTIISVVGYPRDTVNNSMDDKGVNNRYLNPDTKQSWQTSHSYFLKMARHNFLSGNDKQQAAIRWYKRNKINIFSRLSVKYQKQFFC